MDKYSAALERYNNMLKWEAEASKEEIEKFEYMIYDITNECNDLYNELIAKD